MEMDKTVAVIAACITAGFIALVAAFGFGFQNSNMHYYKSVDQCTQSGGQWMPTSGSGTCFRR